MNARTNTGSALTAKCNRLLRAAGVDGVKVNSCGYGHGGTVSGSVAALVVALGVLQSAGLEVSPLTTYSWGTQFYVGFSK